MPATVVRSKFLPLFNDFVTEYLSQPIGIEHIEQARRVIARGRANYEAVLRAQDRGEDITDMVLATLLPHGDYPENVDGRVWVHYAPTVHRDVRREYGAKYGRGDADWQAVARAIFRFVRRAAGNPADVEAAAREFAESGQGKGFQSGTLSPILAAVDPEKFLLINNKSLTVINYFACTRHEQGIASYAAANATGRALVAEHAERMIEVAGREDVPPWMLFDIFTHWLVAVRGYFDKAKEPKAYVTPGEGGDVADDDAWVADMFAEFYPDPAQRRFAETMLVDAVELANSLSTTNWSLTYRIDQNLIRLNVGRVEVLVVTVGGFKLLLDASALSDDLRVLVEGELKVGDEAYRSMRGETAHGYVDVAWAAEHYEQLRPAHEAFIRKASATVSGRSTWARHHAPEIIEYLQSELGRALPNPAYVDEQPGTTKGAHVNPHYPFPDIAAANGFTEEKLARWVRAIERKKQAIIYGPPGTGKTFVAGELARHLIGGGNGFQEIVQFHPAYAYEDFMQGIRPRLISGGGLDYALAPGRFLEFCEQARGVEGTCVMIVDEINRANLARVFGELMYLLEYRDREIPLAAGGTFAIPGNVRIIGTMNTADRSIALVDHALRRRFAFLELAPEYDVLERYHERNATGFPASRLAGELRRLNAAINDPHYAMGISYFLHDDLADCIEDIWRMEIEPYLQEYFYDQPQKAKAFAWEEIGRRILG